MRRYFTPAAACAILLTFTSAAASAPAATPPAETAAPDLAPCRQLADPGRRLDCYDRLPPSPSSVSSEPATHPTPLALRWELDPGTATQLFRPRLYQPNYLIAAHWTDSIDRLEYGAVHASPGERNATIQSVEVKFQLSLKFKMAADLLGTGGNLWAAYTQQSYWQAYNGPLSRPFLATDYEPEFIWSQPIHFEVLGLTARLLNIGLLHQSNGQSDPLSRSWNRVYAELALDRPDWMIAFRPWIRLQESPGTDNNPGIERYMGRGQIVVAWRHAGQSLTFTARDSFSGAWRGSGQLDYAVPVVGGLRGYVQLFSGYGESIIDYNHRQTTIGVGILISDWL